jgi:hypothetical protein
MVDLTFTPNPTPPEAEPDMQRISALLDTLDLPDFEFGWSHPESETAP